MSPSLMKRVRMSFSFDGDDEVRDRCTHLARDPARQHVAEVAGGHAEGRRAGERLRGRDVVDDLRHHPRPVDRVDGRQAQFVAEGRVAEHRLDEILAVVEVAVDRDRVHVRAVDRGHLAALHLARPARPGRGSRCRRGRSPTTPSIAAEPVSPLVAPTIVTRCPRWSSTWSNRRPTSWSAMSLNASVGPWNSSSSQWCVVDLHERCHRRVAEAVVGVVTDRSQASDRRGRRRRTGASPTRRCRRTSPAPLEIRQARPLGRHVQAAVVGEAGEQHVGEPEVGRVAAGRDVPHVRNRSPG